LYLSVCELNGSSTGIKFFSERIKIIDKNNIPMVSHFNLAIMH